MRPSVIRIEDSENLVPTHLFPYAKFPFEKFNPVQSGLFDVYDQDANFCMAASTSSGKTACAEIVLSYEIRKRGGKGMYIAPLKALAQEKIDDWKHNENHHFADLKLSICTGDYILTPSRKKELDNADLIVLTPEMLSSRCRNIKSENSRFLREIRSLIIDEAHMLTVPSRGDHLEVAIMKITEMNPDLRVCLLSATLPNVDEICGWISGITGKNTYLLQSTYRPCPLAIHHVPYFDGSRNYDDTEGEKIAEALRIVERHRQDKFIIFVHTKRTGELMISTLKRYGFQSEFHSADLSKEKRIDLENRFRTDDRLRVVVATSTLSAGINMPARRVIVLGIHRGMSLVANYEIIQECGRSGRPAYDPQGDAYVLFPESRFDQCRRWLEEPALIESQLLGYIGSKDDKFRSYKTLAFHIVSEIHHRSVKTRDDIRQWYSRSLANHQAQDLDSEIVDNVINLLTQCGAIKEEDGELKVTSVGTVASMFYYSPFDVADFKKNFSKLFDKGKDSDDHAIAVALGNTDSNRLNIVSKIEKEEMSEFAGKVHRIYGFNAIGEPAMKAAFCYWLLINGRSNSAFNSMMRGLQFDFARTAQVIQAIDQMGAKWDRHDWLRRLRYRIQYGVKHDVAHLCELPNVGGVRAQRLWDLKIRNIDDVIANPDIVAKAVNLKEQGVHEIIEAAKALKLKESL
jgi:helicase